MLDIHKSLQEELLELRKEILGAKESILKSAEGFCNQAINLSLIKIPIRPRTLLFPFLYFLKESTLYLGYIIHGLICLIRKKPRMWRFKKSKYGAYGYLKKIDIWREKEQQFSENKGIDFILTKKNLKPIKKIHRKIHLIIKYRKDKNIWNEADYWQTYRQTLMLKTGDCEDQAILRYMALKNLRTIPEENLSLIIIKKHMFCAIFNKDFTDFFILDNGFLTYKIRRASKVMPIFGERPIAHFNLFEAGDLYAFENHFQPEW